MGKFKTAFQWLGVYDVIGMPFWIFPPYQKSPNWMILISINFHFLCFSEYKTMLVQAGSFWIPFSQFKTVVPKFKVKNFFPWLKFVVHRFINLWLFDKIVINERGLLFFHIFCIWNSIITYVNSISSVYFSKL